MSHAAAIGRRGLTGISLVLLAACGSSAPSAPRSPVASSAAEARATPAAVGQAPERLTDGAPSRSRPPQPDLAPRFRVPLVFDPCTDRDLTTPELRDPVLSLLDRSYALPASYAPDDLVPASVAGLTGTSGTKLVRSVTLDDLAAMRSAWEAADLTVIVESAYRSYADQAATFDAWVARLGVAEALRRSARPGHSEHQLGTALDLTSPGWSGRFGDWAVESAEGAWLAEHAWEYGFVMSYPAGAEASTCFSYEPWHYRWIGRDAAAAHRGSDATLRDYLADRLADG